MERHEVPHQFNAKSSPYWFLAALKDKGDPNGEELAQSPLTVGAFGHGRLDLPQHRVESGGEAAGLGVGIGVLVSGGRAWYSRGSYSAALDVPR